MQQKVNIRYRLQIGPTYYRIEERKPLFITYICFLRLLFPLLGFYGALAEEGPDRSVCGILLTRCPS